MTENTTQSLTIADNSQSQQLVSIFTNIKAFEDAQRMVKPLAESGFVPAQFKKNIGNCLIALEMANRVQASPLAIMQNMYIVHEKPAWSSQFLIACINASGKFTPLRYKTVGEIGQDSYGMIAWAKDRSGEVLESPAVTIGMAKKEGWYGKAGSKWPTMPDLMLRYRAATFFARTYCPEITLGMSTVEEVIDVAATDYSSTPVQDETPKISRFSRKPQLPKTDDKPKDITPVPEQAKEVQEPVPQPVPQNDDVMDAEIVETPAEGKESQQLPPDFILPEESRANFDASIKDSGLTEEDVRSWYIATGFQPQFYIKWACTGLNENHIAQIKTWKGEN